MKTTKLKSALIVFLSFFLIHCESEEEKHVIKPIHFNRTMKFSSTVQFFQQPMVLNKSGMRDAQTTYLNSNGKSYVKYFSDYEIELSHKAISINNEDAFEIRDGRMVLKGKNGHEIFGHYSGFSFFSKNPKDLHILIDIDGGTGIYSGASGYLEAFCEEDKWHPDVRIMNINGIIVRGKSTAS